MKTNSTLGVAGLLTICTLAMPIASLACSATIEVRFEYSRHAIEPPPAAAPEIVEALAKAKSKATAPDHYTVVSGIIASNSETPDVSVRRELVMRREVALMSLLRKLGVPSAQISTPTSENNSEHTSAASRAYALVYILYGCRGT
jgi:hypothetical protein